MKCTKCELWKTAQHIGIPSRGDDKPRICFVGQAPGKDEDRRGECFVGKAGRHLMRAVKRTKLYEYGVRYHNICRCFPPKDRKPRKTEVEACKPYVLRELEQYEPDVIVPLGGVALQALTGFIGIRKWAGHKLEVEDRIIFPIIHPSAAIREERMEREFNLQFDALAGLIKHWEDDEPKLKYQFITDPFEVTGLCRRLQNSPVFAFDIETTGLDPLEKGARIVGISFSDTPNEAYYVDLDVIKQGASPREFEPVLLSLKRLLSQPEGIKVAQNVKFELKWIRRFWGFWVKNYHDTTLIDHLLYSSRSHHLKGMSYIYTNIGGYEVPMTKYMAKGGMIHEAPKEVLYPYGAGDSDATLQIFHSHYRKLMSYPKLARLYEEIVLPAARVLAKMELAGIYVNREKLKKVMAAAKKRQSGILRDLHKNKHVKATVKKFGKEEFNPNSNPQTYELLFHQLGLKTDITTKTGNMSTDKTALNELAGQSKVANMIKEHRIAAHNEQVAADFIDRLKEDGTIRCDYRQDVVVSGRLASQNPNLQNLSLDGKIRGICESRFIDGILVEADFSQDHVRILANLSGDKRLIGALERDEDIYVFVASEMLGKDQADVTPKEREIAKHLTLGIIFGIGPKRFSERANIPYAKAQKLINLFRTTFPKLYDVVEGYREYAEEHGAIASLLGRFRRLPEIYSNDNRQQYQGLLRAGNFPIQALAADMTMWSMVKIDQEYEKRELESLIVNQQHDSIMSDCPANEIEKVKAIKLDIMVKQAFIRFSSFLTIPPKASIVEGLTWADLKG